MGTLDREKGTYEWSPWPGHCLQAQAVNPHPTSFDGFGCEASRELYRLACELEDVTKQRDAERESCTYWPLLVEANQKLLDATSRERHLLEEVSRFRSYNEDFRQRHALQASEMIRRSGEFAEVLAARERQEATIRDLREQLVAANEGRVWKIFEKGVLREVLSDCETRKRFAEEVIKATPASWFDALAPKVSYQSPEVLKARLDGQESAFDASSRRVRDSFAATAQRYYNLEKRVDELEKRVPGCPACRPGDFDDEHGRSR